jgi:hypothetical protein
VQQNQRQRFYRSFLPHTMNLCRPSRSNDYANNPIADNRNLHTHLHEMSEEEEGCRAVDHFGRLAVVFVPYFRTQSVIVRLTQDHYDSMSKAFLHYWYPG